jgi:hypothetical protein
MIEVAGMILAALLIAWGYSAMDATPQDKGFTYPGTQQCQACHD